MSNEMKIAEAIRQALNEELKFAEPPRKGDVTKMSKKLWQEPPPRSELSFQTKQHDTPGLSTTAKQHAAAEISDNEHDIRELFCMAHGGFHLLSVIDIEHAEPYAEIRKHQVALLAYLNKNPEVTKELLKFEDMQNLFGYAKPTTSSTSSSAAAASASSSSSSAKKSKTLERDDSLSASGELLGSSYFYKLCYNSIDNIWLLCHACNNDKSDGDPMPWFASTKYFGKKFKGEVESKGSLNQGILISLIGGAKQNTSLGDPGIPFNIIHNGEGFGKFIRDWFMKNRAPALETFRQEHNENSHELIKKVDEFLELLDSGKNNEALILFDELQRSLSYQKSLGIGYMEEAERWQQSLTPTRKATARRGPDTPYTRGGISNMLESDGRTLHHQTRLIHEKIRGILKKAPYIQLSIWEDLSQQIYSAKLNETQIDDISQYLMEKADDKSKPLDKGEILKEIEKLMRSPESIIREQIIAAKAERTQLMLQLEAKEAQIQKLQHSIDAADSSSTASASSAAASSTASSSSAVLSSTASASSAAASSTASSSSAAPSSTASASNVAASSATAASSTASSSSAAPSSTASASNAAASSATAAKLQAQMKAKQASLKQGDDVAFPPPADPNDNAAAELKKTSK